MGNWRLARREGHSPLVLALTLSFLAHLNVLLLVEVWPRLERQQWFPQWMKAATPTTSLPLTHPPATARQPEEDLLMQFVEVDPTAVTADAPRKTAFYSTANTRAANPDPAKVDREKPKVDGRVATLKTFDTPKPTPKAAPAQPKPEPPPPTPSTPQPVAAAAAPVAQPEPEAPKKSTETPTVRPSPDPGELVRRQASPAVSQPAKLLAAAAAQPAPADPPRKPYRSLQEARAAKGMLVGEKMKLDGGVTRSAVESSLDVKASPFGDYNYRMVQNVQNHWYQLLDDRRFSQERSGKVEVKFTLHADGTVSQLKVISSDVGESLSLLCRLAIDQAQSFGPWPTELRLLMGRDTTEVTFTFNYIFY